MVPLESVAVEAGAVTVGTDEATDAMPSAGIFVSILAMDVLPVVCNAAVDAPEGSGRDAALIACVPLGVDVTVPVTVTGFVIVPTVVTAASVSLGFKRVDRATSILVSLTGCVACQKVPVTAVVGIDVTTAVTGTLPPTSTGDLTSSDSRDASIVVSKLV